MPAGHPGLLANQTLSDEYCRPSRYKLRLRRLGDRLFICMILFCVQYVINLCTQSTSKIKSVSDLYVYISVVKLSRVTQNVVLMFSRPLQTLQAVFLSLLLSSYTIVSCCLPFGNSQYAYNLNIQLSLTLSLEPIIVEKGNGNHLIGI